MLDRIERERERKERLSALLYDSTRYDTFVVVFFRRFPQFTFDANQCRIAGDIYNLYAKSHHIHNTYAFY